MSYTFRVVFDGVCAYVPEKPLFIGSGALWKPQPDSIKEMAVLLPDLRLPGTPKVRGTLGFPALRSAHFPLLVFRLDDLRDGTTRRVDLVCRDISEKNEQGILFLRREQIRFRMSSENDSAFSFAEAVPVDAEKGALPDPTKPEEFESLWWLPDLARIVDSKNFPNAIKAKPSILSSYKGSLPGGLIARIECTGGRLRTFNFNRDMDGTPLRWRFAAPHAASQDEGSWNRALSNSLALEFFDVRGPVRIELRRLANEVVIEELVLAPAPGASRPVMEISISNREPDLLFQDEGLSRATLPDFDFQPFYELLSQASPNELPLLPVPNPGRDMFFGIQEKPCAGTLMTR